MALSACSSSRVLDGESGSAETAAGGEGSGALSQGDSTAENSSAYEDEGEVSGGFYAGAWDFGGPCHGVASCDIWEEDDCAQGEKCTAMACDYSGRWGHNGCVPIDGEVGVGGACEYLGGSASGLDDCAPGSMCWGVDDNTGLGSCVGFCSGSVATPACPDDLVCMIANEGVLALCLQPCDPLDFATCGEEICVPRPDGTGFSCVPGFGDGAAQQGEACVSTNSCAAGLACIGGSRVSQECELQSGCCASHCDLDLPSDCTGEGQVCEAWFPEGPPAGLEAVGVCALPEP